MPLQLGRNCLVNDRIKSVRFLRFSLRLPSQLDKTLDTWMAQAYFVLHAFVLLPYVMLQKKNEKSLHMKESYQATRTHLTRLKISAAKNKGKRRIKDI